MKTVVGIYDEIVDAQNAINDLVDAGFPREDISLVTTNRWGESSAPDTTTTASAEAPAATTQLGEDVAAGAVTGGVVGGLAGVLLGLGVLAIPGFGPVLAAGPLVAGLAGAGIGAAVGGLVGALVGWGIPESEAELYAESVRRGSVLVGVKTEDERVQQAVNIMNNHGPVDVQRRSEYWRATGWTGYDPDEQAWTADEVGTDHMRHSDYLDYSSYAQAFREHYESVYGDSGNAYATYDPAYRYGYSLANEARYRDVDTWEELETEARRGWEEGQYGAQGVWDDFKDAVRRGWEAVKDALDMDAEYIDFEPGFHEHYQTTFGRSGRDYDWYTPAYRYGYSLAMDERWDDYDTWDDLETEARRGWTEFAHSADDAWEDVKDAVRHAWEEVRDALEIEADYAEQESRFREHYGRLYRDNLHDYDWYEPAYRTGYILGMDERYVDADSWDEVEQQVREDWEAGEFAAQSTWEDVKDAVREGWENVREAFDADDEPLLSDTGYTGR